MGSIAPVLEIACIKASERFVKGRKEGLDLFSDEMMEARKGVRDCVLEARTETKEHCGKELQDYSACLGEKLRSNYTECIPLQSVLQKCAVRNRVGEMKE